VCLCRKEVKYVLTHIHTLHAHRVTMSPPINRVEWGGGEGVSRRFSAPSVLSVSGAEPLRFDPGSQPTSPSHHISPRGYLVCKRDLRPAPHPQLTSGGSGGIDI